jgi:hypothetical protein
VSEKPNTPLARGAGCTALVLSKRARIERVRERMQAKIEHTPVSRMVETIAIGQIFASAQARDVAGMVLGVQLLDAAAELADSERAEALKRN